MKREGGGEEKRKLTLAGWLVGLLAAGTSVNDNYLVDGRAAGCSFWVSGNLRYVYIRTCGILGGMAPVSGALPTV